MPSGIELSLDTWLAALAAAGLVGMDAESWPQAMVSRPVVAGCAGGWLLGDPIAGLGAGAVLELLWLRHLPFGGARTPDPGPAGLIAGAAAAGAGPSGVAPVAVAAVAGWALGWVGRPTVVWRRRLAGRLVTDAEGLSRATERLSRRHRLLAAMDFARGALLAAAFLVPATVAVRLAVGAEGGSATATLLAAGAALGAGAGSARFASGRAGWLVAAGGAAGLVAVVAGGTA